MTGVQVIECPRDVGEPEDGDAGGGGGGGELPGPGEGGHPGQEEAGTHHQAQTTHTSHQDTGDN